MKLNRRLKALEGELLIDPIVLQMPDGRTVTLPGDQVLALLGQAISGPRTREVGLIAQSISSTEPGGGQMIDLARAILNSHRLNAGGIGCD
jgi:hypothetical protein